MLHSFLSSMTNIVGLDASKSYDGEASNYSVLPAASQFNNNHIYFVSNAVGNHQAGFYKSNGSSWVYVGHDHDSLDNIAEGTTNKHFTQTNKTKLDGIEAGAEVNVNADWSSSSGDSQILNKPTANQLIDWTAQNQGSIDVSNLPSLSLTTVQTAANESAQLGLTTQEGDVVVRSDQKKTYIRNSGSAGTMADFTLLETPTDAVTSVNGQTGAVTLNNGDVGLGNVVNVDTTNASNITSGTLNEARLPAIDADNTTISNLEVDNLKTGVLDTDLTAVSANDDTLASAKAIKAYVDATGITSAEQTKLGHISVEQAVDLDTMESKLNGIESGAIDAKNSFTQNDNQYIATDTVKARDSSGLTLAESGGAGIFIEDSTGNAGFGTTNADSIIVAQDGNGGSKTTVAQFNGDFTGFPYGSEVNIDFGSSNYRVGATQSPFFRIGIGEPTGSSDGVKLHVESPYASTNKLLTILNNGNVGIGDTSPSNELVVAGSVSVSGALSKGSGSFDIPHPDPEKKDTHRLRHYFVETPSAGGNIYKYQINCDEGENYIDLPAYFEHLNKDSLVWANPFKHFGRAWGEVIEEGKRAKIVVEKKGLYNILIFGDRKDEMAMKDFNEFEIEYQIKKKGEKNVNK